MDVYWVSVIPRCGSHYLIIQQKESGLDAIVVLSGVGKVRSWGRSGIVVINDSN